MMEGITQEACRRSFAGLKSTAWKMTLNLSNGFNVLVGLLRFVYLYGLFSTASKYKPIVFYKIKQNEIKL